MEEAAAVPVRARPAALQLTLAALTAAFVALATLVAIGHLDALDQYAVDHWMPGLDAAEADETVPEVTGIFLPYDLDPAPWWHRLLDTYAYPASVFVSLAVFAVVSLVLWRRGRRIAAAVWLATWFVANAIEVVLKVAIEKPELHSVEDRVSHHLAAFDHAFPSGHTQRAVLVAGVVLYVWRRAGVMVAAWAALVPVCLVAASWHVPSDVIGGVIFGVLVVLLVHATIAALEARRA